MDFGLAFRLAGVNSLNNRLDLQEGLRTYMSTTALQYCISITCFTIMAQIWVLEAR